MAVGEDNRANLRVPMPKESRFLLVDQIYNNVACGKKEEKEYGAGSRKGLTGVEARRNKACVRVRSDGSEVEAVVGGCLEGSALQMAEMKSEGRNRS